ncbi:MAG: AAA family ATPase [Desulfurococcales archaeon]|nr:AAA family ATPase [Desulfurococcales archaeon]
MRGFILHLGGVPGTGKSTVAELLSGDLSCNIVEASEELKRLGLTEKDPTGRFTELAGVGGLEALVNGMRGLLDSNCIILVSVYPEALIPLTEEESIAVIILRLNPLSLEERLKARGWPRAKVLENVIAEATNYYHDVLQEYEDMVIEIDTTRKTPKAVTEEALERLLSMDAGFKVDWLEDPAIIEALSKWLHEFDLYKERLLNGRSVY